MTISLAGPQKKTVTQQVRIKPLHDN